MTTPCLDCGKVTKGTRCPACQRVHEALRGSHRAHYNTEAYRRHRASLKGLSCHICGLPGSDTVDHVIPLVLGGADYPNNLLPAHRSCNSRKGAG